MSALTKYSSAKKDIIFKSEDHMAFKAIKGTKDMLPQDAYKWHYIEEEWRKICREYGFKEIRTPIFEATELFNRGIGDTTDVVQKEMYTFDDKARVLH